MSELTDELPPLPEARIESYQIDSTMRRTTLHTYSAFDMRDYARAVLAAQAEKALPAEIRNNSLGKLDEFIADNADVHLEQMNDGHWWLGVTMPDGALWHLNFSTKRNTAISVFAECDEAAAALTQPAAQAGCTYPDCSCAPNGDVGCNSPNARSQDDGYRAALGVALPPDVEVTDTGATVSWNGAGHAVKVFVPPSNCRGDPGECVHNGACMYACGVKTVDGGQT